MDAILTHENADFDAVAALLGATKLYPEAIAVLPRRLNRNVREFFTLYGDALALTRQEDLPRRHMKQILLVDTQTPPSTRGVKQDAVLHIVDHHPLSRELKRGWTYAGSTTGATTTFFVEAIREKELPLASIEATLLMLGLYEDTGSLSYETTTARDLRAGAFLLDTGACLEVVNDFLHHPLTPEQHALYQKLLERVQMIEIEGYAIAIAAVRADTYTEEISTLAHQIRDLYDPAALFVLVQMDDHIQMVARSDDAAIDVAEITEAFGGGGHEKAAAALIRNQDLRQSKAKLVKLLKENIRPAITVRALMSFGVHTLEPDATVAQAAEVMHRYGHEGFPVVRRGRLVGVLTRREIDRAMHHQLGKAPIKTLMNKPASVGPDDSLEKLRAVMMESDLGQVPVVEDKKIIGIVTRTDLIKRWQTGGPTRATELATRLEKWLPPALSQLLHQAGETAHELGFGLYVVGGFVRDLLLNQPNLDLDLVVEGDAIQLADRLAQAYGGRVHGHTRFGTAKWIVADDGAGDHEKLASRIAPLTALDFTTARTEFYAHPSALPEVERSSIKQDLHRRDFTINTMAICLDPERYGQLLDPFSGESDLQRSLIRALHNLSFIEDPTRILRAVRLEQRLGFKIEKQTAQLIGNALDMLHRVSGQRIRHELVLIFQEHEPDKAMTRLDDLGVLAAIYPALAFEPWHAAKFRAAREQQPAPLTFLGLLAYRLTPAEVTELADRLKLTNAEAKTLHELVALRDTANAPLASAARLAPSAVHRLLTGYSDTALAIFALAVDEPRVRERIELFRTLWRSVEPELTGDDLRRLGIPPGPSYRHILTRLRAARLDGDLTTREQEVQLVRQWMEPDRKP